jgi:hypothetical protein
MHLFAPEAKGLRIESDWGNYRLYGDDVLATPNEANGMPIVFWQRDASTGPVTLTVTSASGATVFTQQVPAGTGLRRALWPLRMAAAPAPGGGRGGRGGGGGAVAPAGAYTVTLTAGSERHTQNAVVKPPVPLARISGAGR